VSDARISPARFTIRTCTDLLSEIPYPRGHTSLNDPSTGQKILPGFRMWYGSRAALTARCISSTAGERLAKRSPFCVVMAQTSGDVPVDNQGVGRQSRRQRREDLGAAHDVLFQSEGWRCHQALFPLGRLRGRVTLVPGDEEDHLWLREQRWS
jgi:hypothetical protein